VVYFWVVVGVRVTHDAYDSVAVFSSVLAVATEQSSHRVAYSSGTDLQLSPFACLPESPEDRQVLSVECHVVVGAPHWHEADGVNGLVAVGYAPSNDSALVILLGVFTGAIFTFKLPATLALLSFMEELSG
jgi:hypothetical protein